MEVRFCSKCGGTLEGGGHRCADEEPADTEGAAVDRKKKKKKPLVTEVAGKGLGIAEVFNMAYGRPFADWKAEVSKPIGPSTGGGKQALQPIALVAPGGKRLSMGSLNMADNSVKLRDYATVSLMYRQRFRGSFPVSAQKYQDYLNKICKHFDRVRVSVTFETTAEPPPSSAAALSTTDESSATTRWLLLAALLFAIAAAVAIWLTTIR